MLQPRLTMYDCVTTIRWSVSIEFPVEYKDFFPLEHMQNSLIIRYGSQLSLLSLHGQTCSFWRAVFLSVSGNSWWNRFFAYDKKKIFNFPSFSLNWEPLYEYAFVNSCYVSNKCLTLPCFCALLWQKNALYMQVLAFMHELEMLHYIYVHVIHVILMGWFNRRKKTEICFGTFSRVYMMLMIIVFFCFVGQWGRKVGHWAGCRCWRG